MLEKGGLSNLPSFLLSFAVFSVFALDLSLSLADAGVGRPFSFAQAARSPWARITP